MKRIVTQPQILFFFLAILLLVSGILSKGQNIDFALYGGVLKLSTWSVSLFSCVFFILIAINYTSLTLTGKHPKKGLTVTHIALQILSLIPLLYFIFTAHSQRTYEQVSQMNIILLLSFVLFIFASVIHLINFVASLLSKKD